MPSAPATTLLPPAADPRLLRERVRALAENRPGVYRMTDAGGRVLYVGKAKRVRNRLLSYFTSHRDDRQRRIVGAAAHIAWDYVPSEFSAHLLELREIARHRPPFNHHLNRRRAAVFITLSQGRAPRLGVTGATTRADVRYFGPLPSGARARAAVRTMNDLLGLRDCSDRLSFFFAGQGDLFEGPRRAACPRYDFGTCLGPCAGLVSEADYRGRVSAARQFLGGYALHPVDRVVAEMAAAAGEQRFELATRWRERFEDLEWLLAALARARTAIALLTFVYRDVGMFGDDRAHLVRHGLVRASYPYPGTPIEEAAFRAVVTRELAQPVPPAGLLDAGTLDEMLLVMSWFRRHPDAMRRTEALERWIDPQ